MWRTEAAGVSVRVSTLPNPAGPLISEMVIFEVDMLMTHATWPSDSAPFTPGAVGGHRRSRQDRVCGRAERVQVIVERGGR
jgi:hypothetical protein